MDHIMLAGVYALVAQMEAIKVTVIAYQTDERYTEDSYHEQADNLNGIARELEVLSGLGDFDR